MPRTNVVLFRDEDGRVPVLDWLDGLGAKARVKCMAKLIRLRELGHELRRPEADYLRDGIRELRIGLRGINYRMLYFFHGGDVAVLSHGLVKERAVPDREIERAIRQRRLFEAHPEKHTYAMEEE